jgi:hypothetical protein
MLIRMHLSLLISMVSLGVAATAYLRASRVERDQRHLRRRVRELRLRVEAQKRIAFEEASPRNGDRAEDRELSP